MAYNDNGRRPRLESGRSSGRSRQRSQGLTPPSGNRPRVTAQGPYHGPRGTRSRGSGPRRNSGPGYPLRSRNINFQSGRARRVSDNRRLLIFGIAALLVIIILVIGISSCVSSCAASEPAAETSSVDERVAAGIPDELAAEFAAALDQGDQLAWIAANANLYENQGLLELALAQPSAISFVRSYPEAEKVAQAYGDSATQGVVPELYLWDARWGYVDYAGGPFALTGSGPTALSMAYMGLTGKTDQTPSAIADTVTLEEMAGGESGMSGSFLESSEQMEALGLSCTIYTANSDNLLQALDTGTYVLMEVSAGSLTDEVHWIVVVSENENGTVVVYDPTSPEVTGQSFDSSTVAAAGETLYVLSAADTSDADSE